MDDLFHLGDCMFTVRWTDLDTYAHVNNARYFDYLTEGRAMVLNHIIGPVDDIQYFMVDARCVYLKPIDYPNNIKLKHYIAQVGHTSFTVVCNIHSEDESIHYAHTECKLVCVSAATQKPVKIPEELLSKLK